MIRLRIQGLVGMILLAAALSSASAAAEADRSSGRADFAPVVRGAPNDDEPLQPGLTYRLADRLDLTLSHGKGGGGRAPKSRRLEPSSLPARPSGGIKVRLAFRW